MDKQTEQGDDVVFERYEYEDSVVVAADFAAVGGDVTVDVVDDTAVVVVDTKRGTVERDLNLPAGDAQAFNKNGVVSVEVER
ncbi:MAG: hypothetical protein ABEJ68_05540 [Halobacteriaceae archaeon]